MACYLVSFKSPVHMNAMTASQLKMFKSGIEKLQAKGSVKGAYSKVGGGQIVLILESPGNAQLALELRKHYIVDAEIVPLVPLTAEIDATSTYRTTGKAAV